MPWCDPCGKFYSPNTLNADGTCPQHHRVVDEAKVAEQRAKQEESAKVPWHFWVLAIGVLVYLGWRFVQLIGWLI